MIKGGRLSFETQLKIEFLTMNNGSKKCMEKIPAAVCMTNLRILRLGISRYENVYNTIYCKYTNENMQLDLQ